MDFSTLTFTPKEAAELQQPFNLKHAQEAMRAGFCHAISEAGLTPGDVENFLKQGTGSGAWSLIPDGFELAGHVAEIGLGAGALAGAYTGYARNKIERILDGKGDPKTIALKKKILGYQQMTDDLQRTQAVSTPPETPAPMTA